MQSNPSVTVKNQYVYLMDNASINVFDCIDTRTGTRDVYYIQKGRIQNTVQFRESRRTPRTQPAPPPPTFHPPQRQSSSSDEESRPNTSRPTSMNAASSSAASNDASDAAMTTDSYIDILSSIRTVTDAELKKVAKSFGYEERDKYKKLATVLGLEYDEWDKIRQQKERYDYTDMIVEILKLWKSKTLEATVGKLGKALEDSGLQKLVTQALTP